MDFKLITHALLDVITSSFKNINHNLFTRLIFLDLAKAFDTVSFLTGTLQHLWAYQRSNVFIFEKKTIRTCQLMQI